MKVPCLMTDEMGGYVCGVMIEVSGDATIPSDLPRKCPKGHTLDLEERKAIIRFLNVNRSNNGTR